MGRRRHDEDAAGRDVPAAEPQERGDDAEQPHGIRRVLRLLGPGLITGASDDDPSGIATYAQAGATFGYGTLWTVPFVLPLMIAVQEICDRTASATGKSLGALARSRFTGVGRWVVLLLLVALFAANGLNVAADLLAVGEGMALVGAGPAHIWSAVAGLGIGAALFFGSFEIVAKVIRWLCLSLFAYVGVLIVANVDWGDVLRGLAGLDFSLSPAYLGMIVAILGTSISPYLFFWQTEDRVEELRDEPEGGDEPVPLQQRRRRSARRRLVDTRADVVVGMVFSVVVMFSIVVATAATLGAEGKKVESAADAAAALEPIAGPAASVLFALGFIGSGLLAVPVLITAGSAALAALLGKEWSLAHSPRRDPFFYTLIGIGTVGGVLLATFSTDAVGLLVFSALINGIVAAPFLVIVMIIAQDRTIMGRYRVGPLAATFGWITAAVMSVASVIGIAQTVLGG
ncbi:divalent metal cation transporter [Agromyces endophyticus]|uniref:NRAMP family divalent metal transporter n=1 Tax=Agromyces sp. H17E-10 TaxID=2932244 RepID=UPI001FD31AEF|nr:divalent metal cation transporter [Agromyces sp. H17E-10]UOQ90699.1 divalent metal cation transporter [Agromyces sp. H17E-10]